tara:strand:- start:8535 stop:9566 length:1032 start_codon:yes stop_codon:yes gene_type:complete
MLKTILRLLLYPLSFLYGLTTTLRNYLYDTNIFNTNKLPCKVISIGNITTGGSGKTPTVEFLALYLQSIGKDVGIVTRGYGRSSKHIKLVTDGYDKPNSWEQYGDEAFLLSQNLNSIPIIVGESKYEAGLKITSEFDLDVIIMDDGFQHRSLHRDLDIVLINSRDNQRTHKLLPIGNLRERVSGLKRADLIIYTKTNVHNNLTYLNRLLKNVHIEKINSMLKTKSMLIGKDKQEIDQADIKSKNIYLLSAIGDNKGFKKTVEKIGVNIVGHSKFIDHFKFKISDLQRAQKDAKKVGANYIITTEKDLVKIPDINLEIPVCALKTEIHFSPASKLKDKINSLFV